jgi:hypothetical protein
MNSFCLSSSEARLSWARNACSARLVALRSVAIASRPVTFESGLRMAERFSIAGKELSSLRRHWISNPRTRLAVKLVT